MNLYSAKIDAQEILLPHRIRMFFGSVLSIIVQLFLIISSIFNLYCIYSLISLPEIITNIYIAIGCYSLFSLGFLFSVFFVFQISFNRKIWFYKSIKYPQKIRSLFSILDLKYRFKILGLLLLKNLLLFLKALLLFLPFILGAALIYIAAINGGIYKNLFLLSLIFLAALFVFSVFFIFVSKNSFSLCEIILNNNKKMKIRTVLKNSKETINGFEFKMAAFKLSFTLWFLLSLIIIPLVFVVPYYLQSTALAQNMILTKENEKMKTTKAIVFIFPSYSKKILN